MSERPREGTQERYIDQWPKPMFLCTHCDEQTDSDPCQECASVFDERGENYPPVLRFQVVPAPAQPEQPRGEGDDLAARLDGDRLQEWFTEIQASASLLPEDLQIIEAMIARASTHPEQSGRVGRELLELLYTVADELRTDLAIGDEPLPATWGNFCDGINKVERHLGLREPASPTPTEQENDRWKHKTQ